MAAIKIKQNLYSVGALNPAMRIFDVVMKTEYGTTYNAYLLKDEKIALIDTGHHRFLRELTENIAQVVSPEKVDYIILNHTEPDHSGALKQLLTLCPNAEVFCTRAAANFLKQITNDPALRAMW